MNYRKVGNTGLKISEISLGAWLTYGGSVDDKRTADIVNAAVDGGVNFIDLADVYTRGEAEKTVGRAIKDMTRSDLVISSKVFWPMSENVNDKGLSRKHIMESVDKSLQRLGTDYLDLYFCHRFDEQTPVEETVRAMDDLIRQGKILYWGTSVWSAAQIERAVGIANRCGCYRPVVEQPRYNMIDRHIEPEIMPTCKQYGMGLVIFSPLAQGLLTGKYNDGVPEDSRGGNTKWLDGDMKEENLAKIRKLTDLAKKNDMTISHMALAWLLRRPEVSCAIVGATSREQVKENVKGSETKLDADLLAEIEKILDNDPTAN